MIEEKRETLFVLSTLGQTKTYFGKDLSCVKIYGLKDKDVEIYFSIYQKVHSIQSTKIIMNNGLSLAIQGISYLLSLENKENLIKELKHNELLTPDIEHLQAL